MKKVFPILVTSVSLIAITVGIAVTFNHRLTNLKAVDDPIELTMTWENITDYDEKTHDGYHYCDFIISTETKTKSEFGTVFETYGLNKAAVLEDDHILDIDGGDYGYSEITADFEFANITSYQKVTLHGSFDFAYQEDTTYVTVNAEDNVAKVNLYGLKTCYISSITISYHC